MTDYAQAQPPPAAIAVRRSKPFYKDMSVQVFAGMVLGALLGWLWPGSAEWMRTLGELFIRLIGMLVGVIIFCAIVHGVATVREAKKVGRVAIKALVYFEVVTSLALVIGLSMINLLGPGRGMHVDPHTLSGAGLDQYVHTAQEISGSGFLLHLVPHTLASAFTDGNVLQIVFVSVLFAFGLLAVGERAKPVVELVESTQQIVFRIVGYIMWLAPIGAMGAIGFTVARFGVNSLVSLGALVAEFYLTCILFVLIVLWPIARWNGVNLLRLGRYIRTELLLVYGTSSSESVFPQLVGKLRALGCEESIVGLVLPTGYAFNHDGTCLYFAAAPIFLAQAVGIELTPHAAAWAARHPAGHVQGRGGRRRIGHRGAGVDAGGNRNGAGGGGRANPGRAPPDVVGLRRRQHPRQHARHDRHR